MAGLPRAVVLAIGLLLLHFATDTNAFLCRIPPVPEIVGKGQRCFTNLIKTQNNMDNEERQNLVNAMNLYRGFIAHGCREFISLNPPLANFKKILYDCALEEKLKFTCSEAVNWNYNIQDGKIVRMKVKAVKVNNKYQSPIWRALPPFDVIEFGPKQTLKSDFPNSIFFRFMLNQDAEKAACYSQKCGEEFYLACTADRPFSLNGSMYPNADHCRSNKDCITVGGYHCDTEYRICERGTYACHEPPSPIMPLKKEKCFQEIETGSEWSDDERRSVLDMFNLYRGLVAKECNAFPIKPKPALFKKVRYSCKLEEKVKFECPAKDKDFKSDNLVWRHINYDNMKADKRTSVYWRSTYYVEKSTINRDTQVVYGIEDPRADGVRFALSAEGTEVGCNLKVCNNKEYMACTTGKPWKKEGSLYTPGQACTKDLDCNAFNMMCDKEFGICQAYDDPCTIDNADVSDDLCVQIRKCAMNDANLGDFCKALVLIVQTTENGYKVVGVGAAVGAEYILTSVSSKFIKHSHDDLYIVVGGGELYPLYKNNGKDVAYAETFLGHFNLTRWQDLVLIKLGASGVKFTSFLTLNGQKALPDKMKTLATKDKNFKVVEQSLSSPADCEKMFQKDVFKYSEDYNMACAKDSEDFVTSFLSGAPMAVMEDGKFVLYGLRSLGSIDPASQAGHLITPIKPYCDWFKSVSNGAVKCT